jgi:hypothetical protein
MSCNYTNIVGLAQYNQCNGVNSTTMFGGQPILSQGIGQ